LGLTIYDGHTLGIRESSVRLAVELQIVHRQS
jgi:hypothetical protein